MFRHAGFWSCVDTVADREEVQGLWESRHRALEVLTEAARHAPDLAAAAGHAGAAEPRRARDARGSFARCFCRPSWRPWASTAGSSRRTCPSQRRRGTLRGLHYQLAPSAETKIVTCVQGALHDVVLDLRPASPTYGQHAAVELTAGNRRVMVCPRAARTASSP